MHRAARLQPHAFASLRPRWSLGCSCADGETAQKPSAAALRCARTEAGHLRGPSPLARPCRATWQCGRRRRLHVGREQPRASHAVDGGHGGHGGDMDIWPPTPPLLAEALLGSVANLHRLRPRRRRGLAAHAPWRCWRSRAHRMMVCASWTCRQGERGGSRGLSAYILLYYY